MVRWFSKLRSAFERLLEWIVIALIVAMVVVVVLAVVYRKAGASLVWYDEVASVILAWLTYYGASLAALKRAHIGFPGLVDGLPARSRRAVLLVSEAFVIGFFMILAWTGFQVLIVLEGDTLVSLPEISVQLTQSVIPIGAVLFIVAELLSLPEVWHRPRESATDPPGGVAGT